MNPTQLARAPAAAFIPIVDHLASGIEASDFTATRPAARVGHRQHCRASVTTPMDGTASMPARQPLGRPARRPENAPGLHCCH
jgi:hypothetical protein